MLDFGVFTQSGTAADGGQRSIAAPVVQAEVRGGTPPPLSSGVDMICIANDCAKRACKTRLLAHALCKSSDFLICMQGKS
jgi:hypothetical protein